MLLLLLLGLLLVTGAGIAAYGLRKECSAGAIILILIVPFGDGILSFLVLDWLGYASVTSLVGGLMFGVLSLFGIQALVSSRRLLGFRLAWQQLLRRKRQAALLIAGLMIGSAIISSSLIVGDSLDQTVREEVEAAWGDTDVLISGYDTSVGQVTEIPQSIVDDLREANLNGVEEFQAGRVLSTAGVTSEGIANTSVPWFALEHRDDV